MGDSLAEHQYKTHVEIDPSKQSFVKGPAGILVELPGGFLGVDAVMAEKVIVAVELLEDEHISHVQDGLVPVSPLVSLQVILCTSGEENIVFSDDFAKEVVVTLPHCIRNADPKDLQVHCKRDDEKAFNKIEVPFHNINDEFVTYGSTHFSLYQLLCDWAREAPVAVGALGALAVAGLAKGAHQQLFRHIQLECIVLEHYEAKTIAIVMRAFNLGIPTLDQKVQEMLSNGLTSGQQNGGWTRGG